MLALRYFFRCVWNRQDTDNQS